MSFEDFFVFVLLPSILGLVVLAPVVVFIMGKRGKLGHDGNQVADEELKKQTHLLKRQTEVLERQQLERWSKPWDSKK